MTKPCTERAFSGRWAVLAVMLVAAVLPGAVVASETLVRELEQRLSAQGVDELNAYLGTQGSANLVTLHRSTTGCELQAVSLSIQLARGSAPEQRRESQRHAKNGHLSALAGLEQQLPFR